MSNSDTKRQGQKETDYPEIIPLRYGDDPYVWACWLYYEDRMTQAEIAETMGISRATVNSYLAEARERGIVNISIDPNRLSALTLAEELKRHFGLDDCLVIPSDANARSLVNRLGVGGAHALNRLLRSGDILAVDWGRTVMSVAEHAARSDLKDLLVVQATGGIASDLPYTPELCASRMARALHARCVNIAAPAVVRSARIRDTLLDEPLIGTQFDTLKQANKLLLGISSLRKNSTLHASGFFDSASPQEYFERNAVGALAGRFIDERGRPVIGSLDARTIGITLDMIRSIPMRIAVAGGVDKIPAILATLRGGYANIFITDAATGRGILKADGAPEPERRVMRRSEMSQPQALERPYVKKLINEPKNVVEEMIEGALKAHSPYLQRVEGTSRAIVARHGPRQGKVGLVIGGGSGHEPCFLGYVGKGMADAVAIGNVFSSPPPDPIHRCARAASGSAGVMFVYGNYTGDILNFELGAELAQADGIETRTVLTTDDVASSPIEERDSRRGVAGNFFVFKIAGAACDLMWSLDACEAVTRKANRNTYTIGVALEPCSLPHNRRHNFDIAPDDLEMGIGIHGEPGVARQKLGSADDVADAIMDRILNEMKVRRGDQVAVLVNSLGSTPLMELYILNRRVLQRLQGKGVTAHANWVGHYCTSLDMTGASITILHLDEELRRLLDHPCRTAMLQIG